MKKTNLLLFVVCCLTSLAFGQNDVKVEWGEVHPAIGDFSTTEIISFEDEGFYALKTYTTNFSKGKKTYELDYYDNSMQRIKSVTLDDIVPYRFLRLGKNLYLFSKFDDKKQNKLILNAYKIDRESLSIEIPKPIVEISFEGIPKDLRSAGFILNVSPDNSKICIINSVPQKNEKTPGYANISICDENFSQIWSKKTDKKDENYELTLNTSVIDNNGNIYAYSYMPQEEKRKSKPKIKKRRVIRYDETGEGAYEFPTGIEYSYIIQEPIIDKNGDIVFCGFYTNAKNAVGFQSIYSVEGYFYLKIDSKTKEIKENKVVDFTSHFSLADDNFQELAKKRKKITIPDIDLFRVFSGTDGGVSLIGERKDFRFGSDGSSNKTNYNEIIMINTDSNGDLLSLSTVNKKQQYTSIYGTPYVGCAFLRNGDKFYALYNDSQANDNITGSRKSFFSSYKNKATSFVLVECKISGEKKKDVLFSMKDSNVMLQPLFFKQISANELIIRGTRGKKEQFVKISIN